MEIVCQWSSCELQDFIPGACQALAFKDRLCCQYIGAAVVALTWLQTDTSIFLSAQACGSVQSASVGFTLEHPVQPRHQEGCVSGCVFVAGEVVLCNNIFSHVIRRGASQAVCVCGLKR